MFHLFQMYVAEVLSCCNISRSRKRTHVDVVFAGVVVPMCAASEVGVSCISRHVTRSPPA